MLFRTLKVPIETARINGRKIAGGMRSRLTQTEINGTFRITSITLPMYMEAITAQKISGYWVINNGPGCTPCTIKADIIKAVIGAKGIPSASSGATPRVWASCHAL